MQSLRLKYLRLSSFEFALERFIYTIRQLKNVWKNLISADKSEFEGLAKLWTHILESILDTNRQQRLDIVMPDRLKLEGKIHSPIKQSYIEVIIYYLISFFLYQNICF